MGHYAASESFEDFKLFSFGLIALSVIHIAQYAFIAYSRAHTPDAQVSLVFLKMLATRLAGLVIGTAIGGIAGVIIVCILVTIFLIYPLIMNNRVSIVPINVPHLIERLGLLTIITLGELLVGISLYFDVKSFSIVNVLSYLIIVNLFVFYFC